jgi:hypothetical protein
VRIVLERTPAAAAVAGAVHGGGEAGGGDGAGAGAQHAGEPGGHLLEAAIHIRISTEDRTPVDIGESQSIVIMVSLISDLQAMGEELERRSTARR